MKRLITQITIATLIATTAMPAVATNKYIPGLSLACAAVTAAGLLKGLYHHIQIYRINGLLRNPDTARELENNFGLFAGLAGKVVNFGGAIAAETHKQDAEKSFLIAGLGAIGLGITGIAAHLLRK